MESIQQESDFSKPLISWQYPYRRQPVTLVFKDVETAASEISHFERFGHPSVPEIHPLLASLCWEDFELTTAVSDSNKEDTASSLLSVAESVICRRLREISRILIGLLPSGAEGEGGKRVRSLPDLKAEQVGNQLGRRKLTTYRNQKAGTCFPRSAARRISKRNR